MLGPLLMHSTAGEQQVVVERHPKVLGVAGLALLDSRCDRADTLRPIAVYIDTVHNWLSQLCTF